MTDNKLDDLGTIVGEPIPDAMEMFSGAKTEPKIRVQINEVDTKTNAIELVSKSSIEPRECWVKCNFCNASVHFDYLDNHFLVHTTTYKPIAPVKVDKKIEQKPIAQLPQSTDPPKPKLQSLEHFHFRKLDAACAGSSVSSNGRYSDFTVIFWQPETTSVKSATYSGGTTSYSVSDWERFCIHVVYDKQEDYFVLSAKLLKRGQYSSYDSEEGIPDRICMQEELFKEIKRALIFFKISPLVAYKKFRKLFKQNIVVDRENDIALIAQTENSKVLNDRLKKTYGYQYSDHYS